MNTDKEKWIEKAMQSVDGMQRATAAPFLFTRVEARLQSVAAITRLPVWSVRLAFLVLAVLFTINIGILSVKKQQAAPPPGLSESLMGANYELY